MRLRSRLTAVLVSVLASGGALAATAAPASAALPQCNLAVYQESGEVYHYRQYVPATNATASYTQCILSLNSRGPGVVALQQGLNQCFGAGLVQDGVFGTKTRTALINAQKQLVGLSPDGVFGPATHSQMRWWTDFTNDNLPDYHDGCYDMTW